jgi:RimJ/RimL family protein N-acetyltransferase
MKGGKQGRKRRPAGEAAVARKADSAEEVGAEVRAVPATLRTARMLMRSWSPADAPALAPILESNVAHLAPWIPAHVATPAPLPALVERLTGFAADFTAGRAFRYALLSPDESQVLGEADLFPRAATGRVPIGAADHVELGYWLDAAVTGRGLATEATRALFDVSAAVPGMSHVEIRCDKENGRSAALPQRLGFHLASEEAELQIWRRQLRGPE